MDMFGSSNVQIVPSVILSKLVYYACFLIAGIVAVEVMGIQALSDLIRDFLGFIPDLLAAFFIFIAGLLISNGIRKLIQTSATSLGIPSAKIIANFLFYFLFIHVLMIALKQIGVETDFFTRNVTVLLGGAVLAFALGYGFASKDFMANILASMYSKKKFGIGDEIEVGNLKGKIVTRDSTSVTLRNDKGQEVIVPMKIFTDSEVVITSKAPILDDDFEEVEEEE